MAEELEFHQALLREKLLRQGVPQLEVDFATRRAFGNASRWQERLRELWQFKTLENLLARSWILSAVAVEVAGVHRRRDSDPGSGRGRKHCGLFPDQWIAAETTARCHMRPVGRTPHGGGRTEPDYTFCTPFFRSLEKRHDVFANVFAFNKTRCRCGGISGNENIPGVLVSGQFFEALETPPLLGRYLTPQDDQAGGSPAGLAVVISETSGRLVQPRARYCGPQDGHRQHAVHVVGVMPKRFIGADLTQRPKIFAPLSADPIIDAPRNHIDAGIHAWWISVMRRLQPGVSLEQANAELLTVSDPILRESGRRCQVYRG